MGFFSGIVKGISKAAGIASNLGSIASGVGAVGSLFAKQPSAYDNYMAQSRASVNDIPARIQAYKDAGIHPIFGLSGQQWSPQGVTVGDDSMGARLSEFGQNIGRAGQAFQTQKERAVGEMKDSLTLERMRLENDLLKSQITTVSRNNQPAIPPVDGDYFISGQGDVIKPQFSSGFGGDLPPDIDLTRTPSGQLAVVPSQKGKQLMEDMIVPEMQWYIRRLVEQSPEGYTYNPFTGAYSKPQKYSPRWLYTKWRDWDNRIKNRYYREGR